MQCFLIQADGGACSIELIDSPLYILHSAMAPRLITHSLGVRRQLPSPPLRPTLACRKVLFQKYNTRGWHLPILGDVLGKIEIVNIDISSVGNLQLPVSNLFYARRR